MPLHAIDRPDGVRIGYRIERPPADGTAPRHAVLLLHGLASNLTRWSEFVDRTALRRDCVLIAPDLRGHERSPTRGRVGHDLWCDDLAALLDAEGIGPAVLVGHSLGAQVALQMAARHGGRVAALVLVDPVFGDALHGRHRWFAAARPLFVAAAAVVRALNALGLRRASLPSLDLQQLDREAREALRTPEAEAAFVARYSSARADLRSFRSAHYLQEVAEMFAPLPRLESIAQPALVLLSTGATFASPDAMRAQARRLPHATIATVECHHWPLTERPAEVREAIERWVEGLPASAPTASGVSTAPGRTLR